MEYVGTRWHKTDLHLHTKASDCYHGDYSPKSFVDRALAQGLNCIAITDHNSGAGIDEIKEAAKGTGLVVFPGVEVTCSEAKVHLLVLFDTDKTGQDVEDFLIGLGLERKFFGDIQAHVHHEAYVVAERAKDKGALVIPAHIDDYSGVSSMGMESKKQFFKLPFLHAVQVAHEELLDKNVTNDEHLVAKMKERYGKKVSTDQLKAWKSCAALLEKHAILTFSDNPQAQGSAKHGLWGIGNGYSWIKMGPAPTLESLRQALLMPGLRVLNMFQATDGPPRLPATWIRKLSVTNTTITEPDKTFMVEFSPQLTTIIGGRGSGKSAILKFLRGALDLTQDLASLKDLKDEFSAFIAEEEKGQGVLKPESSIEIEIAHNDQLYRVRRTQLLRKPVIEVSRFDEAGQAFVAVEEAQYHRLFPVDIYSQKQVYEVAKSPNALRARIDAKIPACLEIMTTLDNKVSEFLATCGRIRQHEVKLREESDLRAQLAEFETRANRYATSGMADLIAEFQVFEREASVLHGLRSTLESKLPKFDGVLADLGSVKTEDPSGAADRGEFQSIVDGVKSGIDDARRDLESAKKKVLELSAKLAADIKESAWQRARACKTKELTEKKTQEGVKDNGDIQTALNGLNEKQQTLRSFGDINREVEELKARKGQIVSEIIGLRLKMTKERRVFLTSILGGTNVSIDVKPFGDREHYEAQFRAILDRPTAFDSGVDLVLETVFDAKVMDGLEKAWAALELMRKEGTIDTYDKPFRKLISKLGDEQFDKLRVLLPEDLIVARYRSSSKLPFKDISNASAGQKTASILTFVLSHGTAPLVLDQPEDDLDNHLVYGMIVDRLRAAKARRQIIIVTHNANIPVNGDAEYTIAMRSDSNKVSVLQAGTIEQKPIQKEICEVMEGGEEAFGLRSDRYSFRAG